MSNASEIGKIGEAKAKEFLLKLGYTILQTNYRFGKTEIDIIAQDQEQIVFVEVKTRSSDEISSPEDAVNKVKKKNIIETANHYLETKEIENEARFDIISIIVKKNIFTIVHSKDAFNSIF